MINNILGNTIFYENKVQRAEELNECFHSQKYWKFLKEFSSTLCICQKYAKPKLFMPTTSKNAKFKKFGIKICHLATLVVSYHTSQHKLSN